VPTFSSRKPCKKSTNEKLSFSFIVGFQQIWLAAKPETPPAPPAPPRELERVKQYLQTHGAALDHPSQTADSSFIPPIERALAMILAREALGAE
jgi:hypothetical protein